MNKPIQVGTSLERQIPEFIKNDYETFVKFIKAYYEYMEQSNVKLEDIRSIDRTLDKFVLKFKTELAALFPTANIQNERVLIERISEFYNARGSSESYKLLFRLLFNKDADIFYPSTQILRASDGKWIQDKSVFVKSTSGNLYNFKGKIIKITTRHKQIDVFCPNVLLYKDDIYEVFIDKQYHYDISIDNTVELEEDSGYVLPCPAKYKIVKQGAGFEAGSIYNLKTSTGDGSAIKITRIGTGGSIKAIEIVSFGLDYSTNFYAQLSNKSTQALLFYHPITQYIAGTPRDDTLEPTSTYPIGANLDPSLENPASQDGISDYSQWGYFILQDYMYYESGYNLTTTALQSIKVTNLHTTLTEGSNTITLTTGNTTVLANALDSTNYNYTLLVKNVPKEIVKGNISAGQNTITGINISNLYVGQKLTAIDASGAVTLNTNVVISSININDGTVYLNKVFTGTGSATNAILTFGDDNIGAVAYNAKVTNVIDSTTFEVDLPHVISGEVELAVYSKEYQSDMIASDWFADTTYVGDIIASFYTNEAGVVIDNDTAEIKIELGSVAVYPGYYAKNDGFISDESYIHDGEYYQLFSYVIKAEEQLENYSNIVKSLLHPAGLKMFGEFNIYKNFDVPASPLLAFIRRQFFENITQISEYFGQDISKSIEDTHISQYIENIIKDVNKQLTDDAIFQLENVVKNVNKILDTDSVTTVQTDIDIYKNGFRLFFDNLSSALENVINDIQKQIDQDQILAQLDIIYKNVSKVIPEDEILAQLENVIKAISQVFSDTVTQTENVIKGLTKLISDSASTSENVIKALEKLIEQEIISHDSNYSDISKLVSELIENSIDDKQLNFSGNYSEIVSHTENIAKNFVAKYQVEIINQTDTATKTYNLNQDDIGASSYTETITSTLGLNKNEDQLATDLYNMTVTYIRSIAESQSMIDVFTNQISKTFAESNQFTYDDADFIIGVLYDRSFDDNINTYIEAASLIFDPFSGASTTTTTTDDYFLEEYAAVNVVTLT